VAQQNHWSERGRATSVANADALGRPRRSVLSFGMKFIARLFHHLRQMPETLAALSCMFMIFGLLCLVAAVLPLSGWTYEDRAVSYQEFWRSGGGVLVVASGLVLILLAVAFYKAQRWVCYAVPLGFVALTIYAASRPDPTFPNEWAGVLLWVFFSYWYFNRKRKVVACFRDNPRNRFGRDQE
jgi:hypothetical protein